MKTFTSFGTLAALFSGAALAAPAPNGAPYIINPAALYAAPATTTAAAAAAAAASSTSTGGFVLRTGLPRNIAYHAYYQTSSGQHISLLPLIQHNSNVTHVNLFVADVHDGMPGNITIGGVDPSNTTFLGDLWSEVKQVQAKGVKVLASFGGSGADSYLLLQQNFSAYYPVIPQFLKKYGLDGIDLDIEPDNNDQTVSGISLPLKLIQNLRKDMPADFLITMAPVARDLASDSNGYSGFSYPALDKAAVNSTTGAKLVNWYNAQFYSGFGSPSSTQSYDQIISAGYFTADRVVMGVLADNQDGSGYVPLATVKSTAAALYKKYPGFGGVDGYEDYRAGSSDGVANWQWYGQVYGAYGK